MEADGKIYFYMTESNFKKFTALLYCVRDTKDAKSSKPLTMLEVPAAETKFEITLKETPAPSSCITGLESGCEENNKQVGTKCKVIVC